MFTPSTYTHEPSEAFKRAVTFDRAHVFFAIMSRDDRETAMNAFHSRKNQSIGVQ